VDDRAVNNDNPTPEAMEAASRNSNLLESGGGDPNNQNPPGGMGAGNTPTDEFNAQPAGQMGQ
jgi:hypothetical protein